MLYKLGRFLQLLGLIIVPVGLAGTFARPEMVGERAELGVAAGGAAVFGLGWLLQHGARSP
jgi:hypothetical protein